MVRWCKEHLQYAERAFLGHGRLYKDEARIADLERLSWPSDLATQPIGHEITQDVLNDLTPWIHMTLPPKR